VTVYEGSWMNFLAVSRRVLVPKYLKQAATEEWSLEAATLDNRRLNDLMLDLCQIHA